MFRRTLKYIDEYPRPEELYEQLMTGDGWPYMHNREQYILRDRALVSILYLIGLRISEAVRLHKRQFKLQDSDKDYIAIEGIKLSKSKLKGKPRREQYRRGYLPLDGERVPFSYIVLQYLERLREDDLLFPFQTKRGWQIVNALIGLPCHWLRAFCEDYLYEAWSKDILAVSDYMKVDARTLQEYIRKRYLRYEKFV
jgi:integrase